MSGLFLFLFLKKTLMLAKIYKIYKGKKERGVVCEEK